MSQPTWEDLAARPLRAEIVQVGRWRYAITINEGLSVTDPPWSRFGLRRARAKAERELNRRRIKADRKARRIVVGGDA